MTTRTTQEVRRGEESLSPEVIIGKLRVAVFVWGVVRCSSVLLEEHFKNKFNLNHAESPAEEEAKLAC